MSYCRALSLEHLGENSENQYLPIDGTIWDAEEAYQLHWCEEPLTPYLICRDGQIIMLDFSREPTPEQIQTASAKLNAK